MTATPQTSALNDELVTSYGMLVEANRRLQRTFERSLRDAHDLSLVAFEALLRLGRSRDHQMSMSQLADQMVLTSGGVTRLIDRLEGAGYVSRRPCVADRRVHWAQLTDAGLAAIEAATATHVADLEVHFAAEMSPAEMSTLTVVCERLRNDCG